MSERTAAVLAACWLLAASGALPVSSGAAAAADRTVADTTASTEATEETLPRGERNDGILRIGLLHPVTGPGGSLGLGLGAAADYAINRVNEAGGWNDERVELVRADEGTTTDGAREAIDELLAAGVDAVVGPAGSTIALATLDRLMAAGVLTCSPTATSLLLDDYPNRDLFFRTIPSDSLQMEAIASQAEATGATSAAVVYLDDEYGRGLAGVVERALPERGVDVAASLPFHRDDDLDAIVRELTSYRQTTIIVLADALEGMRVLEAISDLVQLFEPDGRIVVNDSVRPSDPAQWRNLDPAVLEMIRRIGPIAMGPDPTGEVADSDAPVEATPPEGAFGYNVVDCINLIVLAAIETNSDNPAQIAGGIRAIADRGLRCETFADCVGALRRQTQVAYAGANAHNELYYFDDERGDLSRARLMVYRVNADTGFDIEETTILVGPVR